MKSLILLLVLAAGTLNADVVRPSPEYTWVDSTGTRKSSREFLGRPVVVLVANSPRSWAFRSQVGQLQRMYDRLAAEKIVCVAAFSQTPGVIRSNIPFVLAADGPRLAHDFQASRGFAIAIIGKDGNMDFFGHRVIPVRRIYDILDNSFVVQKTLRRN
ncbi:MAG: hypothetical protein IAE94_07650 [Chthoniobacterales bacterium]|nr:hypothetical protein [Chthoniobacterales bacterium]